MKRTITGALVALALFGACDEEEPKPPVTPVTEEPEPEPEPPPPFEVHEWGLLDVSASKVALRSWSMRKPRSLVRFLAQASST